MPDPLHRNEALEWVGGPLADASGASVGEVKSVYIDSSSHEPAWLVASLAGGGRRGRGARIVAVPVDICAGAPGLGVWTAAEAGRLRTAPVVDPTRPLQREHELTICEHFGIAGEVGRAATVTERDAGTITAIPPRS